MNASSVRLHRLNAGNYVTDLDEGPGSWCVSRYLPDGRKTADGWLVLQMRPLISLSDGTIHHEFTMVEWARTLDEARFLIDHLSPTI